MQLCVSRQDFILDVLCTEEIHRWVTSSWNVYRRLECHQCLPYTKASLESRLCGSCRVSGTTTVEGENMESSNIFLNRKQCKSNVTSYMTEPTKYTTNGRQHL